MQHLSLKQLSFYPKFHIKAIKFEKLYYNSTSSIDYNKDIKLNDKLDIERYKEFLTYYSYLNMNGYNIYVLPIYRELVGYTDFLLDDLKKEQLLQLKNDNLYPLYILETSPHNYQVIIRFYNDFKPLHHGIYMRVNRYLVEKYQADVGSIGEEHYFRVAGYTNRKERYRDEKTGLYPFVKLKVIGRINENLNEIISQLPEEEEEEERNTIFDEMNADFFVLEEGEEIPDYLDCLRYVETIYRDKQDESDKSDVDYRVAFYATLNHFSLRAIYYAILECSPNLIERKGRKYMYQYVARTVRRAAQKAISAKNKDKKVVSL